MLVHDKVFALRACERRTGSRARRGEHSARSRAWLQQALTGEQQRYLHNISTLSTLSTAWAGPGVHVCIILEFTQSPGPDLELAGPWMALEIVGWWAEGGRGWRCAGIFTSTLEAMVDTGAQASAGSMNGREKLLRIPHMIHYPLDIRHL